ncbi:uncharacterized protein ASPGLDRAFT_1493012 [Aspergillus glaucus CBS 516.65]|uniref:Uncharacterized protein n=1 Tax=Aspergillus glaucus CBS 516.65 TaxID=1160497 RepID=A0A1L9VHV0_ASPGL|nr:hypothetical protein ASPGLDRAFT_1493012 [Aspergillus glaucus CBS 516.65]OJJ83435.1 hypothetical protein ASPGLDRAFT_1493012 [Aspergillus glaucus CBS 516.65]
MSCLQLKIAACQVLGGYCSCRVKLPVLLRPVYLLTLLGSLAERLSEPSLLPCCNSFCSGSTGKGQRDLFWASSRRLTSRLLCCLVSSFISFYPCVSRNSLDSGVMTLGMQSLGYSMCLDR